MAVKTGAPPPLSLAAPWRLAAQRALDAAWNLRRLPNARRRAAFADTESRRGTAARDDAARKQGYSWRPCGLPAWWLATTPRATAGLRRTTGRRAPHWSERCERRWTCTRSPPRRPRTLLGRPPGETKPGHAGLLNGTPRGRSRRMRRAARFALPAVRRRLPCEELPLLRHRRRTWQPTQEELARAPLRRARTRHWRPSSLGRRLRRPEPRYEARTPT